MQRFFDLLILTMTWLLLTFWAPLLWLTTSLWTWLTFLYIKANDIWLVFTIALVLLSLLWDRLEHRTFSILLVHCILYKGFLNLNLNFNSKNMNFKIFSSFLSSITSASIVSLSFWLLSLFFMIRDSNSFLVNGMSRRNPKVSVKKPGMIKKIAAIAIEAPENIS